MKAREVMRKKGLDNGLALLYVLYVQK